MNPPPLLVSFASVDEFLHALPMDLRNEFAPDIRLLVDRGLPPIVSVRCLATLFGYSPKFVGAMRTGTERYYRTFSIPRRRKSRVIHAPRVALKVIQKWFGCHLEGRFRPPGCVFGFVTGRSTIQAARVHCGAEWVYSIDLEDFFPTTSIAKVVDALVSLGYPRHGAELASKLCCYRGYLSQGSPASPVLSNLVFQEADDDLTNLAEENRVRYTRYADDIVFSGRGALPENLPARAKAIVESRGWSVSPGKERLSKLPGRLKVHGLLVHGDRPRLTKGYRNRIRAFKHLLEAGRVSEEDAAKIRGHLSYARSVEAAAKPWQEE